MLDTIKLAQVVSKFSPLLGSALAIPSAINLIDLLLTRFRVPIEEPEKLIDEIEKNDHAKDILLDIQNNIYIELQQIAAAHAGNVLLTERVKLQEETKQLEIQRLSIESARALTRISRFPSILSLIILIGFFSMMALVVFIPLESKEQQVLYILVGTLATNFSTVIAFWIGSSQSSKIKDLSIKNITDGKESTIKSQEDKEPILPRPNLKQEEPKHEI